MVAELLSFPMRLRPNGRLATVQQNSDDHIGEELAVICLSRPGERPLVPGFGIEDPAFQGDIPPEAITSQVDIFGVPALIRQVHSRPTDDTSVDVTISFEGVMVDDES